MRSYGGSLFKQRKEGKCVYAAARFIVANFTKITRPSILLQPFPMVRIPSTLENAIHGQYHAAHQARFTQIIDLVIRGGL